MLGGGLLILALIIASVVVGLLNRTQNAVLLPEGTPGAAVQQYLVAIEAGETQQAYEYLSADLQEKCTLEHFRDTARYLDRRDANNNRDTRISLESEQSVDNAMEVRILITEFNVSAPFDVNEYSHTEVFLLEELDGGWRFVDEPWPMYGCPDPANFR
ncbi:MAG: hypothetical protein BZY73_05540 [SAR202 cluster bacterium Casp-Chloro-G3]|nr:MAG: hypothetical protein BZY73_05540 [SAR202 cluster bacterium Casp-Chloro-G3]